MSGKFKVYEDGKCCEKPTYLKLKQSDDSVLLYVVDENGRELDYVMRFTDGVCKRVSLNDYGRAAFQTVQLSLGGCDRIKVVDV